MKIPQDLSEWRRTENGDWVMPYKCIRRGKIRDTWRYFVEEICKNCGEKFFAGKSLNPKYGRFCSCKCGAADKRGPKHNCWRGGRTTQVGYVRIWMPQHPKADTDGYIREHRLVMEQKLGRPLTSEEHVHHINGQRADNRMENLVLMTNSQHAQTHFPRGPNLPKRKEES